MIDQNATRWFIYQLTGSVDTQIDWRCIHDTNKEVPAHNYRGSIDEIWPTLVDYNSRGYGVFCTINALDGVGRDLHNVSYVRAHFVDLDDPLNSQDGYDRAAAAGACFAVQTSPGKFHLYWKMEPYAGNDFFTLIQKKLCQLYNGDRSIIDATRVMRVPGFLHQKNEPFLVTGWELPSVNVVRNSGQMQQELAHVNIVEHFSTRSPLGEPEMSAPSLEWLKFAMTLLNPNELDRAEWLSFSAAIKQAGWLHSTDEELFQLWSEWCDQYEHNDAGENRKLWDSIKDTEVGWNSIQRRTPVKAYMSFHKEGPPPNVTTPPASSITQAQPANLNQQVQANDDSSGGHDFGEILSQYECQEYFKECFFVNRTGEIVDRSGRFMNATRFNGKYGGKQFIISSTGKLTDEPWKAALRSTCWTVPKVDHVRFLPEQEPMSVIHDDFNRTGLNIYIPPSVEKAAGDVTPFLTHIQLLLPDAGDQKLLLDYLAHCVKYPGFKIPWAPLIQSTEGAGKKPFIHIMEHCLGSTYVYKPNAQELVASGSKFNAWMRAKLMIIVDEIKVDERRDLIEVLKPMISENKIEIQQKGVDQEMEDNAANWLFFSNFKDAIPINQNGRRYAIFYSAIANEQDLLNRGMNKEYFDTLFEWIHTGGGKQAMAAWFDQYPIEKGAISQRAPKTSTHEEALKRSRSPMEIVIGECIEDGVPGFCGGYVSSLAVIARSKAAGIRAPNTHTVQTCLEGMGYISLGRANKPYFQENANNRANIFACNSDLPLTGFGRAQGYE